MAALWGMTAFRSNLTFPGSDGSLSRWATGRFLEQLDSREPSRQSSYPCRAVFLIRMTFGIAFILQMLVGLAGPQMVNLLEHRAMLTRLKLFRLRCFQKMLKMRQREAMPLWIILRNRLPFPIDLMSPMLDGWALSRTEKHRGSLTQEMQSRHCRLVLIGMVTEALFPLARTSLALVGKTGLQASLARRGNLDPLRPFSLS